MKKQCPIKNCDHELDPWTQMRLFNHLRHKHPKIGQVERTKIIRQYFPTAESGFKTRGISDAERALAKSVGIN